VTLLEVLSERLSAVQSGPLPTRPPRIDTQANQLRADFRGTFAPDLRASDKPIAIACFRLLTFCPDRPECSFPCFISCIARSTIFPLALLYLRAMI
jgi:hypothetical protein